MDIPINVKVRCAGGLCGRSTCVIVKPSTEKVTHLVVRETHFPHEQFLVPVEEVLQATAGSIELRCTDEELHKLQPFVATEYVKLDMTKYAGGGYLLEPFEYIETESVPVSHESVPYGEVALHRGARVDAVDGTVGHIDEFLVNAADGQITHLVMREGHLWAPKEVTIPVAEIDHIRADRVYLRLNKRGVEALPTTRSR
jgi:hypothetical protein